jgi:hypothetical protein
MIETKAVSTWMAELGFDLAKLVEASGLERRVVEAIVACRYTPSPEQRRRLAHALGVESERIAWGHAVPVEHLYGHGPQFGRTP